MRSPSRWVPFALVLSLVLLIPLLAPAVAAATVAPIDLGARFDETGIGNSMAVVSGDFNGDGKLDVASATTSDTVVTVSLGNGDGTYDAPAAFTVADLSFGVAAGDVDFDGDLDLVSANVDGTMSVLLGDGSGSFAAHVDYTFGAGSSGGSVSLVDADRDGDLDAVTDDQAGVGVLFNNGDGTFGAATSYAHSGSDHVLVADLNSDSSPDLVSTSFSEDTVAIWLNDGAGGFGTATVTACAGQPWGAGAGDFDHDGDADLLVAAYTGSRVYLLLNDGSGSFSIPMSVATAQSANYVVVDDFNRDGDLDAAVGGYTGDIFMLRGSGTGSFTVEEYSSLGQIWDMDGGDFNADGLTDVVASAGAGGFTAYLNTSGIAQGIAFGAPATLDVGRATYSTCTGDLDRDGDNDAVALGVDGNAVTLLNDGTGGLTVGPISYIGASGIDSALADVDRDGDLDLVATDYNNGLAVASNAGDGSFGPVTNLATPSNGFHLDVADFDLNGYVDIVVSSEGALAASVYLNDGSGGFPTRADFATASYSEGVCAADLNRDGKPDFVVMNFSSTVATYYWGDGAGGFTRDDRNVGDICYIDADAGDLNGDGAVDLAVGNWAGGSVSPKVIGILGPAFAGPDVTTATTPVWTVELADLSRDGKLDVFASDGWMTSGNPGVTVLRGDGSGGFEWQQGLWNGHTAYKGSTGDIDGDGRLDLVVPDDASGNVGVLLSSLPDGSVQIDGGVASCFSRRVTLDLASASGVEYRARNRGGDWTAWTPFAASVPWRLTSGDGTKEVEVQYRDAAGNLSDAVSDDIAYSPEMTPPTSSQTGGDAWYDVDATVSFSAVDDPGGSGVDHIEYSLDGGGTWTTGDSVTIPAPGDGSNDGTYTVQYRAVDNADNVEDPAKSCWVGIDTQAPSTSDDAPGGWVSGDTTINFWSGDAGSGVRYTQYRIDGGLWKRGTSVTIPDPGDGSNDGVHKIQYRSVDLVMNIEETRTTWLRVGTPAVHVSPSGSDSTGIGSEAKPYQTIGHAMGMLLGDWGETVYVHAGVYSGDVTMKSGVALVGDDAATTSIVGSGAGTVVTANGLASAVTVRGLTIANGYAYDGGGIVIEAVAGTSTIADCVLTGNRAGSFGGGLYAGGGSSLVVDGCSVTGNTASAIGGGLAAYGAGDISLVGSTFAGNVANVDDGGGVGLWNSGNVTVTRCSFTGNASGAYVGAFCVGRSVSATVSDSLFADNSTNYQDYGSVCFYMMTSPAAVDRCTFVNNPAYGGAVNGTGSPPTQVSNSILRNGGGPEVSNASVTYSNVLGGFAGAGNIDADPLFVDAANGDFHLQDGSPCIGGGDPAAPGSYDLDQIPRPQADNNGGEGYLDMGCYERPSFVLQAGAASTWFSRVECDSMFSIGTEMRFRNAGPGGEWSDWEPFNTTRVDWPLDISGGDGTKWVEAEYRYLDIDGETRVLRQADSIDYAAYSGDTTPPVTTVTGNDSAWHGEDVELYVEGVDTESGVERTYIDVDGNGYYPLAGYYVTVVAEPDGSNDGIHHISYFSDDWAGNRESAGVVDVKIDTQAPTTTVTGLTDGWLNATSTMGLDVADTHSGPDITRWRLDGTGAWRAGTAPDTSGLGEGDHSIEYYSIDAAGNIEDIQTLDFSVDRTPPTVWDDSVDAWFRRVTWHFDGDDALSGGVHGWQYRIDGGPWVDGDWMTLGCVRHKQDNSGDHVVDYRASDAAGNIGTGSCHAKLDGQKPVTTLSTTVGGAPLTVKLTVDEPHSGVATTSWSTDGGSSWTDGNEISFSDVGDHALWYYSVDALGNRETTKRATIEVAPVFFDTSNGAHVYSVDWGTYPVFTVGAPTRIMQISDYHWNDPYGASYAGQSISLLNLGDSTVYGPWPITDGAYGWGFPEPIFWYVYPDVVIPAGTYRVIDSQPTTWSANPESGWTYFTWVYGEPAP